MALKLFLIHYLTGLIKTGAISELTTLPNNYLQRTIEYTTAENVDCITKKAFIKPAADKYFQAKIYNSGTEVSQLSLPSDVPILVSEPVNWEIEFRCFVRSRNVLAISSYWSNGKSTEQSDGSWRGTSEEYQEAKQFCTKVINSSKVKIPNAVVIDVGKITGRGWAVIEANSAYSSGLYGCDPMKVIQVVKEANATSQS